MARPAGDFLPTTAYAVLGLLSFGAELSGYELRQWALRSLRFFYWSPAQSHVYKELRRLEELGLATGRAVAQEDRPDKRVFAITDAGRAELRRWLHDAPVAPPVVKFESALRLFLGHAADPERLVAVLDEHRAAVQRTLDELTEVRAMLVAGGPPEGGDGATEPWSLAEAVAAWGEALWRGDLASTERLRRGLVEHAATPPAAE
jgi:DNA-binding PadR family transcriptional regulator